MYSFKAVTGTRREETLTQCGKRQDPLCLCRCLSKLVYLGALCTMSFIWIDGEGANLTVSDVL